jgi:purine-binding chemotaxis protein CheW
MHMSFYDGFSETEHQVLNARAERLARAVVESQEQDAVTVLIVSIRSESYAIPMQDISNIHENIPVVAVPCAPQHVVGVANVRGHIIPVLDLAVLLNIPGEPVDDKTVLLTTNTASMNIALHVETVNGSENLTLSEVLPFPSTADQVRSAYVAGVLPDGTVLLNVGAILNDPALIVDDVSS